jgi:Pvc16 N-terminal domain
MGVCLPSHRRSFPVDPLGIRRSIATSGGVSDTHSIARYHAIAATTNAIRLVLENAAATSEWSAATVEIYQAANLQKPVEANKAKLSVYLYRVLLSTVRRDRGLRLGSDGVSYRPSIPLDLHYLVTAWSSDARSAHQLLGWAIRVLHDTPVLPTGLLNEYQAGLEVFGPDETVELAWEPLSVTDLSDIWQVSSVNHAPSGSYIARSVMLDSEVPLVDGALVKARQFDYAKGPA